MPRLVYLTGIAIGLLATGFALTYQLAGQPLTPGVTEGNVRRIREGMTLREVEALLGGPGEGGVLHDWRFVVFESWPSDEAGKVPLYGWSGDGLTIVIRVDQYDQVREV